MTQSSQGTETGSKRPALALAGSPRIVGLVGNPRPMSRTHRMVSAVADAFAAASGGHVETIIDLADLMPSLFDFGSAELAPALDQVLHSDVLVVGSPTYKATYTGVLKAFCDHIGGGQLAGTLALPTMMGGAYNHALAVEAHLRPLLVELGATCATPGLYVLESDIEQIETVGREYIERIGASIALRRSA